MERAQEAHLVGPARRGPAATSRTSPRPPPPGLPAARGRPGGRGDRRRRAVHHAGRRRGPGCSPRPGWPTGRCRRTTSRRIAVPNALHPRTGPTRRGSGSTGRKPLPPEPGTPGAAVFPFVFTTFRVTEHHTAGGMSRWTPRLNELQPEMFLEVSPRAGCRARAAEREWAHVGHRAVGDRGARWLVTHRSPSRSARRPGAVHQIGGALALGPQRTVTGDAANDLLSVALDRTCTSMETKAATCDIRPGFRPRGPALCRSTSPTYRRRAGLEH